jgi:hypothetical protein
MRLTLAKIGFQICTPVHIAQGKVISRTGEIIFGAETAGEKIAGANGLAAHILNRRARRRALMS